MAVATGRVELPARRVLAAFVAFILVGGGAAVAIRITYGEMAPFWSSASRFGVAALAFWVLVAVRRLSLPKGRALVGAVLFGLFTVGLAFALIGWGLTETPASVYQVLMALIPLVTLFLSYFQGVEAITSRGIAGSILAAAGIAVTVAGIDGSTISLPHIAAILAAAVFVAEGGVVIKKFPPNPPVVTNAIAMTTGALVLAAVSIIRGEAWALPTETDTWVAFAYLVVMVTFVAFLLYMFVLEEWTASGASYGFVLIPLVTVVVAATVAGEKITGGFLTGTALVLAGVYVGALMPTHAKQEELWQCHDHSGGVLHRCG